MRKSAIITAALLAAGSALAQSASIEGKWTQGEPCKQDAEARGNQEPWEIGRWSGKLSMVVNEFGCTLSRPSIGSNKVTFAASCGGEGIKKSKQGTASFEFQSKDQMRVTIPGGFAPGQSAMFYRCENAAAHAAEKKTPEQACQAQALGSIARQWPNVLRGNFRIYLKDDRCLVFLQAPAIFEGKRSAMLIDGKSGDLLSEFYAPTAGAPWADTDRGLCSYRGGKFPTSECSWSEYLDKASQM